MARPFLLFFLLASTLDAQNLIINGGFETLNPRPHSGKRMIGMVWYHPKIDNAFNYDYHEFIQGMANNSTAGLNVKS